MLSALFINQTITHVEGAEFVVTYQRIQKSGTLEFDKNGFVTEDNFTQFAYVNFNQPNADNLSESFPDFFTPNPLIDLKISDKRTPYLESIPTRYYYDSVLNMTHSTANAQSLNFLYSESFNLTESPDQPFIKYYLSTMVSGDTSILTFYLYDTKYNGEYNISASIGLNGGTIGFVSDGNTTSYVGVVPDKYSFEYAWVTFLVYWNNTMAISAFFYESDGTMTPEPPPLQNPAPVVGLCLDTLLPEYTINRVEMRLSCHTNGNSTYIHWIDSSRQIIEFESEYEPKYNEADYGITDFTALYKKFVSNNRVEEYLNITTITKTNEYGGIRFINRYKVNHKLTQYVYETDNTNVDQDILDSIRNQVRIKADIEMNNASNFTIYLNSGNISINRNETNYSLSYLNQSIDLNSTYLTVLFRHSFGFFGIIILDGFTQKSIRNYTGNIPINSIVLNNVTVSDFYISKDKTPVDYVEQPNIYDYNYILDEEYPSDWFENKIDSIEVEFPRLSFTVDSLEYNGKTYYPFEIFVSSFYGAIVGNTTYTSYMTNDEYISFLYTDSSNITTFNYTNPYYSEFLIRNGGLVTIVIVLADNSSDAILIGYNIFAEYAFLYSTDPSFENYFIKGMDIMLPLILISFFAFAMYSNSKSKYFLIFGFMMGIVVLYFIDMITIATMIMLLGLSLFFAFVLIKKEGGNSID